MMSWLKKKITNGIPSMKKGWKENDEIWFSGLASVMRMKS